MKKMLALPLLMLSFNSFSYECEEVEDLELYVECIQEEKMITNQLMIKFIRDTGVGLVITEAVKRFVNDYGEMTGEMHTMFRRTHRHAVKVRAEKTARAARERAAREEEERRRNRREGADDRRPGWGGHLDNYGGTGVARGGWGA